jgi:hypothetical protein
LLADPELSVVLFDRIGWADADYQRWSQQAAADGRILCLPTQWQGRTVLRLAFVNPDTSPAAVLDALGTMR